MTEKEIILEQYKIAIDGANKISERRWAMNNLLITLNWWILTFLWVFKDDYKMILIGCIFWFFVSVIWALKIKSYKEINKAKFEVINLIERNLPIKLYEEEWRIFKKANNWSITEHEVWIPVILVIIYICTSIILCTK